MDFLELKRPSLSEIVVLLSIVLSFLLRYFVHEYPIAFVPPPVVFLALTLLVPRLAPARLPLFVLSLTSLLVSLTKPLPWLNEWPLDLYLIAGACLLFLRWNGKVDLKMRWSFRFSRPEILSALSITSVSVVALTIYFLNNREVAKTFPLPDLPTWSLPLAIIAMAIVNALREELVYRVVFLRTYTASFSVFWAVMIQALSFGFLHFKNGFPQGWIGVGLTSLFGVLMGIQFLWSRSVP